MTTSSPEDFKQRSRDKNEEHRLDQEEWCKKCDGSEKDAHDNDFNNWLVHGIND